MLQFIDFVKLSIYYTAVDTILQSTWFQVIKITFVLMDIEYATTCTKDYLDVYDGDEQVKSNSTISNVEKKNNKNFDKYLQLSVYLKTSVRDAGATKLSFSDI